MLRLDYLRATVVGEMSLPSGTKTGLERATEIEPTLQ